MGSLYALYRQPIPEVANGTPLVLGLFQSVSDAQAELAKTYGDQAPWRPPSPGHQRWELWTGRYLFIAEEFTVHSCDGDRADESSPHGSSVDNPACLLESLKQLSAHVSDCLEELGDAARESHENWITPSLNEDDEHLKRLQGNERFYLGQAAAFAWIVGCLERLIDQTSVETVTYHEASLDNLSPSIGMPLDHLKRLNATVN